MRESKLPILAPLAGKANGSNKLLGNLSIPPFRPIVFSTAHTVALSDGS